MGRFGGVCELSFARKLHEISLILSDLRRSTDAKDEESYTRTRDGLKGVKSTSVGLPSIKSAMATAAPDDS